MSLSIDVLGSYREAIPLHSLRGGVSLHEKSHDVSGGSPLAQLLLHPVQTCHKIAFCEVTNLSASPQDQGPGQPGIGGHDLGVWRASEVAFGLWREVWGPEGLRM